MKVIAAIVGLVLVVAIAVAALKAYANSTDGSSKSGSSGPSLQDTGYLQAIQQYNLAEQAFGQIAQDRGQSAGDGESRRDNDQRPQVGAVEGRVVGQEPRRHPANLAELRSAVPG